jgi:predicted ArsR family transcriptional regulator
MAAGGKAGESRTRREIVRLLKTEGPMDSAQLAERLGVTRMAVRQHLYGLEAEKLVSSEDRRGPLGRPARHWRLTREADRLFPDAYAELNVSLIGALGEVFGPGGLKRVIEARKDKQESDYRKRISQRAPLRTRVEELARIRTTEGYMAEMRKDGRGYLLIENHCPICAAASVCQGFCSTELDLFRSVLGADVVVERVEHILSGDRRCAYRISPAPRATRQGS